MKDQNSIDGKETPSQKYERALDLFTESVLKPDHDLRGCAHNQGCYDELMEIREHVIKYLKTLKEVTHHTNADESDELETAKLIAAKDKKVKRFVYAASSSTYGDSKELPKIENQIGDGDLWSVSEYELASRMSYIIWGESPDKKLLDRAASGELFSPNIMDEEIDRMLFDPKAITRSIEFVKEWLNLDRLKNLSPNIILKCLIESETFNSINLKCRIDTKKELEYFNSGGILNYVLDSIEKKII